MRSALLALLLTACVQAQGVPMQSSEIDRVVYAWREAGLPWSERCAQAARSVHVVVTDDTTALCRRDVQSCSLVWEPTVVVGAAYDQPGWRIHELLHVLSYWCLGYEDPRHTDKRVWWPSGLLVRLGG